MSIFKIFTIFKGRKVGVNVSETRENADRIVRENKAKTGRDYTVEKISKEKMFDKK